MELKRATQAADRGSRTEAEGAGVPCVKIRFLFMFRARDSANFLAR
jgi:hypothetical protein